METGKVILSQQRFHLTIERLCQQILEDWNDFSNVCFVGIQPRGVRFSDRLIQRLREVSGQPEIRYGKLDITFYRDDFRMASSPIAAHPNEMDFVVADKNVLLIDDVLYTGRTIQAALSALQHYGRPRTVELITLVDRRFNRHLPIQADYSGLVVDAVDDAYVKVRWQEKDGIDEVILFDKKN